MRDIRPILPSEKRPEPRYCIDCGRPTRHHKEYCSDHIERSAYVKAVIERAALFEEGSGNLVEYEILYYVQSVGKATLARVARDLNLATEVVVKVTKKLVKRGMLQRFKNKRNAESVRT